MQLLGDSMTGITNHAKKGDLENFCDSVGNFSTSVCGLTEAASQVRDHLKSLHIEWQSQKFIYTEMDSYESLIFFYKNDINGSF